MRVLFYGTPRFALPTLDALLASHEVVGVVTQPDRPAGRGRRLAPPPVKERAVAAGIPVLQPERLRDPRWLDPLRGVRADVAVVVAFGQILPRAVLDVPARGSINVHASLLPKYRGAAPIAWALIRGEAETGVTTFQMDEGMIVGRVHGCNPWPGAATEARAGRLTIWRARAVARETDGGTPGTLVEAGGSVVVTAGVGAVEPTLVQPESRRTVTWPEYLRGARLRAGDRLTAP